MYLLEDMKFITKQSTKKIILRILITGIVLLVNLISVRLFIFEYQETVIYPGQLHPDAADMEFGAQISVVIAILLTIIIVMSGKRILKALSRTKR